MFQTIRSRRSNSLYRATSLTVLIAFLATALMPPRASDAQMAPLLNLPVPGTMVPPSAAFTPVLLKGMTIHPEDPLRFDFIIDSGNSGFDQESIKVESERLVKYFLASMTVPKDDLWVNLSPVESDRIIPDYLGKTILGRDMLAQDYMLKQLTASLIHPETELGEKFWSRVRALAEERYGTSQIPMNTFNKVWIVPEAAQVYEYQNTVYITHARLKVMTDNDYTATHATMDEGRGTKDETSIVHHPSSLGTPAELETEILREIIIPEIENEVNEGQNFAPLRQIYHSLILAKWYKETIKDSLLSQVYVDQNKTAGVNVDDESIKEQIYERYMEAYQKGVFNFIKEDYDRLSSDYIPRKYFSGGIKGDVSLTRDKAVVSDPSTGDQFVLEMKIVPAGNLADRAMAAMPEEEVRRRIHQKVERILGALPEELLPDIERAIPVVQRWLEEGDGILVVQDGLGRTPVSRSTLEPDFFVENETVSLGKGKTAIILQRGAGMDDIATSSSEAVAVSDEEIRQALRAQSIRDEYIEEALNVVRPWIHAGDDFRILNDDYTAENRSEELLDPDFALKNEAVWVGSPSSPYVLVRVRQGDRAMAGAATDSSLLGIFAMSDLAERREFVELAFKIIAGYVLGAFGLMIIGMIIRGLFDVHQWLHKTFFPLDWHEKKIAKLRKQLEKTPAIVHHVETETATYQDGYVDSVVWEGDIENPEIDRLKQEISKTEVKLADLKSRRNDRAMAADVGGIDMNDIAVEREGEGVAIRFDEADLQSLLNMPIEGFAPVIINVIPLPSILPLLGLEPRREEEFDVSRRN